MQKTSYYRTVFRRRNVIKEALLNFFLGLSSGPRLLLEVFIRRNMGERYFSFSTAITLLVVLAFIPLFLQQAVSRLYGGSSFANFWGLFLTWYLYLAGFLYMAVQRRNEIRRLPSVFDFARFSLSTGQVHPYFRNFEVNGQRLSVRTIETVLEPGVFFLSGLIFWFSGQPIGFVVLVSSVFYSFSYVAAYHAGDNFLMDKIDERICNEELVRTFTEGPESEGSRGFHFYGRRPADPDARRKVADLFVEEEETVEAL